MEEIQPSQILILQSLFQQLQGIAGGLFFCHGVTS
jgi:hypothetical protein